MVGGPLCESGDIFTQDAVVAGKVKGTVRAESRLEVQASSQIEGQIVAARMQLEEGAILNGTVQLGKGADFAASPAPAIATSAESPKAEGS